MPQELLSTDPQAGQLLSTDPGAGSPTMTFAVVNGQRVPLDDRPMDLVSGAASTLNPLPALQTAGNAVQSAGKVFSGIGTGNLQQMREGTQEISQTLKGLLDAQTAVKTKGDEAFQQGDYVSGVRHYIDWLLPVIGPAIDKAADEMQQGKPYRGAGEAIGLGLGMFGPQAVAHSALGVKIGAIAKNPNPAETTAVEFGLRRKVPVNAGVATSNRFVQGVQAGADNTPIGGMVERSARQREGEALARVGGELADDARAGSITPDQAGANIANALEGRIQAHAQFADHAYDALRKAESDPKHQRTIQTGTRKVESGVLDAYGKPITGTEPITETMGLPVDLRGSKAALKPIYEQLTRQYSVTQAQASAGYKALQNIVQGPDYAPLSQVEADLGAIKSIARGADMPELRTQSQGLAASGVKRLQGAIDLTAARAGPDVTRALQQGRAATVEKFATADVLDRIKREPVGAYRQVVAAKDSGIDLLRTIQKQTPQALPQIARAYLDDVLATATAEGGFDKGARLAAEWQKLGAETKALLFPQKGQIQALDSYFLLAKKLAESPNPSRTALTATAIGSGGLIFTHPATGIPITLGAGALSKILRSPKAVQLLTKGLRLSLGPGRASVAAQALGIADLASAAREAGVTPLATPADRETVSGAPQPQRRP